MSPTILARLAADEPTARRVAAYLAESLDPDATVCAAFEGDGGRWQFEVHFRAPPDQARVRALVALVAGEDAGEALAFETVTPRDWVKASLAGLPPVKAGRFVVHGAHDRARVPPNAVGIEIEAALAFGTGHHGSTRGCLLALDALAKRRTKRPRSSAVTLRREGAQRPSLEGRRRRHPSRAAFSRHLRMTARGSETSLDLGTGSGVLAIAAAKIFHARVLATDLDPRAVVAARGNARRNRAGASVEVIRAAGVGARRIAERAPYDLVFGNILLGPLQRMAAPLARLTAPGARVVLSGLLAAHANGALAAYRAQGLRLERRIALDGWVTLVLRR